MGAGVPGWRPGSVCFGEQVFQYGDPGSDFCKAVAGDVGAYTKEPIVQGAQYFFDVLQCNVQEPSFEAALTLLYDAECIPFILSLPVFNPQFSWTLKMVSGLRELVSFLIMRNSEARDFEMIGMLQAIQEKHIAPMVCLANQGKRERANKRNVKDSEIFEKMMPVEDLKLLIRQSYEDLLACKYALVEHPDDWQGGNWIKAAAVCVAGPNFIGKQAGRPGEWDLLTKKDVQTTCLTSSVPVLRIDFFFNVFVMLSHVRALRPAV